MEEEEYASKVENEENGIEEIYDKYSCLVYADEFFSRFDDVKRSTMNIPAILLYLWKKCKLDGYVPTIDDYEKEFIRCAGHEKFTKEVSQFSKEFERSYLIVTNFISEAEKKYYSGFIGKIRRLIRTKKAYKKIE